MKKYGPLLLGLAFAAGCSDAETPLASAAGTEPARAVWGVNADNDGIDDGTEWELANRHAPVLFLPNLIAQGSSAAGDWTRPANVGWYLANTRMRIHHNNCDDHQLLDFGQVNATNLLQQAHQRYVRKWYGSCVHESPWQYSNGSWHVDDHYFLQQNDWTHPGLSESDPGQWSVYFHAYRNNIGGVSIQYWFFYAYNDGVSGFNHEGDWEHLNVKLDAAENVVTVYFSAHNSLNAQSPWNVTWHGTHPVAWVADGSHANYPTEGSCNGAVSEGLDTSCWTLAGNRWFTWAGGKGADAGFQGAGLVNLGERPYPMSGQQWIQYSGRWGEVGNSDDTSGPRGPAYNKNGWWTTDAL